MQCSQIIWSVFEEPVRAGVLQATEVADFADNLVFDDRAGICLAYDPRDALGRRL